MSLRKFGILCMLRVAGSARADYEEDTLLQNEGQVLVSKTRLHKLRLLECDDDKMPTEEDNQYCAAFDGNAEACHANGCSMLDSVAPSGKTVCKAECKTSSADGSVSQESNGLAVPQEVTNAVQKARELAERAGTAAAAKIEAARLAEDAAMQQIKNARQIAEAAAEKLARAEAFEQQQQAAKDEMEAKVAEAAKSDSELNSRSQALEAAVVVKQQALDLMNEKLQAKKEKETEWDMEDMMFKSEMEELNSQTIPNLRAKLEAEKRKAEELFQSLENQIATATARRNELGKKRGENNKKRQTEGKAITKLYTDALAGYTAEKNKVESLEEAAKSAQEANEKSTSAAKASVSAYYEAAEAYKTASEEKATAKEESDSAQAAAVESEFLYATKSSEMAQALQEKANADELKMRVEKVSEYAGRFYENLNKIQQPEGNPMMAVMSLVKDPAMKPCLASYNVVITAANGITQNNAEEVMTELKTGLVKIDSDRSGHFQQWCGTEDFARWIWGANEIQKVDLNIAL